MDKSGFVQAVEVILRDRVGKQNKVTLEKLGRTFGIIDKNLVKELTELAIVQEARKLAHAPGAIVARYQSIVALYHNQVNLSHRTSESMLLQQYSTPAPIGYLMGMYCGIDQFNSTNKALEPSAGNGLLTIAGHPSNFDVNEISFVRYKNLETQGFNQVTQRDATQRLGKQIYDAVLTNPPFGRLDNYEVVEGYKISDLDHLMAIRALECMKDTGRAAIIIGGHTSWDDYGRITQGKNRLFFNYLHHHFNVSDTLMLDGHKLYSRQGTSFDVRIILIDGRKVTPEGVAPLKKDADVPITSFDELLERIMRIVPTEKKNSMSLIKLKAKAAKAKLLLAGQELGMPYIPASQLCNSLEVDTPDSMGYEMHLALRKLKAIVTSVDGYVQSKLGYASKEDLCEALSAEQTDAVALAIYNIEERRQALIVGDQTGIGKGRIAAAMIRYGSTQGLQPIFITEKPNLFSDLYRDLKAIGSEALKPYIVNAKESKSQVKDEDGNVIYEALDKEEQTRIIESGTLPKKFDYVMLTYSQISGGEVNKRGMLVAKSKKGQWIETIAKDNVIVLDESHNASGDSNTGQILQDIVHGTKGVTFLSATFAKRPDNMPIYAMKTAMSEANMSKGELISGIEKGGVALQEVLSAQLVQHGQMIRRERSFEGIEVNYLTLDNKAAEHQAISDNITQIVRDIIAFQKDFLYPRFDALDKIAALSNSGSNIERRKGTKGAGVDSTPYFSKVFQVVNQMLFAIKADAVADRAIMRLKEGKKAVIAFSSTMGSFLESLTDADGRGATEDGTKVNADFATVLQKGLDGVLRYTEKDPAGESIFKVMDVSELSRDAQEEYARIASQIQTISSGIVISPIDLIKQKLTRAGYTVSEVTGRKLEVELKTTGSKTIGFIKTRKRENATDAFRKFQNNEVDVLMINQSGSTGASAHAIPTKKVSKDRVKQRVMILLQAELDINTEVQKRGRINRTGQIYKPIYDYVFSAIPAEKRLMMMLQKKLKSLDANTTSNQKQSEAVLSVDDFLNKIGDHVVTKYVSENPEVNAMLGYPISKMEPFRKANTENVDKIEVFEDAAHKVSGRVAVLTTKDQEKFYNEILKLYRDEVTYLKQTDEYDLEVETLDLKSVTLEKNVKIVGKGGTSAFGDNTYLEKCEINILKKPYSVVELENLYLQILESRSAQEVRSSILTTYKAFTDDLKTSTDQSIDAYYNALLNAITDGSAYNKIEDETERQQFVKKRTDELNAARQEKKDHDIGKIANQARSMNNFFKYFITGRKLFYPLDKENASSSKSLAVCLGIKIDFKSEKPFRPSNMKLILAIASSKKRIDIPLSRIEDISSIIAASMGTEESPWEELKIEWQQTIKANTKDRGIAYIVTGNLLQSYGEFSFLKGRLISYTTEDGKTRKGRLMPDGWSPGEGAEKEVSVKVPILKALKIIQSLPAGKSISSDNNAMIVRNYDDTFKMMLPGSKSSGGDLFLDQQINALMQTGRFDKVSNSMVANFNINKLKTVLEVLQRHNTSLILQPHEFKLIKGEVVNDIGDDEIPEQIKWDVKKEVETRKTEPIVAPSRPPVASLALIRIKAKAAKAKLLLNSN